MGFERKVVEVAENAAPYGDMHFDFGALWVDGATSESQVKDVWRALVNSPEFVWCNHPDRLEAVRVTRQSTEAGTDWCVEFPAFDCDFATNGYF